MSRGRLPQEAQKSQDEFFDLELWCAEVDYHCISLAGGAEVTEGLSDVFGGDGFDGFQFNDEAALYE